MFKRFLITLMACGFSGLILADEPTPTLQKAVIDTNYKGGFPNDFPVELNLVQTLVPVAQQEISTNLGFLQYQEGFQHPVVIRFSDGAPATAENPYFYVQTASADKSYSQALIVNVEAFGERGKKHKTDDDAAVRHSFYYAMTTVIFNDHAAGDPDQALPTWAQEGTAVYISGMGDHLVKKVASEVTRSHVGELVDELNRPVPFMTRRQYARYYLAVQYIVNTGGASSLQAFIRDLLSGKSVSDTVLDVFNQDWDTFEDKVERFSKDTFSQFAREDENSGAPSQPRYPK